MRLNAVPVLSTPFTCTARKFAPPLPRPQKLIWRRGDNTRHFLYFVERFLPVIPRLIYGFNLSV